jgi:hypothetical protein
MLSVGFSTALALISLIVALFASENMRAEIGYAAEQAKHEDSWGSTPFVQARFTIFFFRCIFLLHEN